MGTYGSLARLYDDEYRHATEDVDLYLRLLAAERVRGPVLDLGCGTGRISLPLARAGHRMTGVDLAEPMLRRARRRRRGLPPEAAIRLRFARQDIVRLQLPCRYRAAILAFSTLNMVLGADNRSSALVRIARHLEPGGLLVVDLANPSPGGAGGRRVSSFRTERLGHLVEKLTEERSGSADGRLAVRYSYLVRRWVDDAVVDRLEVDFELDRVGRREVEGSLYAAGFDVERVLGDHRESPFSAGSPRLIVVARRLDLREPVPARR